MNFENQTFIHNNTRYVLPDEFVPNSLKFELFRLVMFRYDYDEFNENFDYIYNNLHSDQIKPICYMMKSVADEYLSIKNNYENACLGSIAHRLEDRALVRLGRMNNKRFHVKFISMICCWVENKHGDEWNTIDYSYEINDQIPGLDEFFTLNGKLDRFISHFDLSA